MTDVVLAGGCFWCLMRCTASSAGSEASVARLHGRRYSRPHHRSVWAWCDLVNSISLKLS